MNSGCIYTGINKQLMKEEKIKTKSMGWLFEVFNADKTKNGKFTQYALLEVKINRYKKQINTAVIDLNSMYMFLEYN